MKRKVLLCGNSILIAGLLASLSGVKGLEVAQVELTGLADLPDPSIGVVIVDLSDPYAAHAVTQFCVRPGLLVLGVDVNRSVLTVLSGSQMTVSDVVDLTQLIKRFVQSDGEKLARE